MHLAAAACFKAAISSGSGELTLPPESGPLVAGGAQKYRELVERSGTWTDGWKHRVDDAENMALGTVRLCVSSLVKF